MNLQCPFYRLNFEGGKVLIFKNSRFTYDIYSSRQSMDWLYSLFDWPKRHPLSPKYRWRKKMNIKKFNWLVNLSKLWEIVKDRETWCAAVPGVSKSRTWLNDWAITTTCKYCECSKGQSHDSYKLVLKSCILICIYKSSWALDPVWWVNGLPLCSLK